MSTQPIYSDEQLMAYADGELPPDEAARIRAAAAHDAALGRRIDNFTRTGRALGGVFAGKLHEPVPDHLLQLLQAPPDAGADGTVRALPARKPRLQQAARWWPHGLAASLLVALAVTLGLPRSGLEAAAPMIAGLPADAAQISTALERTPSGEPVALAVAGRDYELLPTASFRDGDGRYCREFSSSDLTSQQDARGLACRREGAWTVEIATTEDRVEVVQDEGYFPAGTDQPTQNRTPISQDAERALIQNGWR